MRVVRLREQEVDFLYLYASVICPYYQALLELFVDNIKKYFVAVVIKLIRFVIYIKSKILFWLGLCWSIKT